MKLKLLLFLLLLFFSTSAQVVINEVMCNNQSTRLDEGNEYSDWVELYNAGPSSINLHDYGISDNSDSLLKWKFPAISLHSHEYLTIWCSGKNKRGSILHTNFTLNAAGASLYLSNPSGNIIDNYFISFLPPDRTFGRLPDGSASIEFLSYPSYGLTNNNATVISGSIIDKPVFNLQGGFYPTSQNISLTADSAFTIRYTLDGSDPTETSPVNTSPIIVHSRAGEPNNYSNILTGYSNAVYLPDWHPPLGEVYKCNIIRARCFRNGYFPGPIVTQTYFIDPDISTRYGNLPIISVVTDPENLFNDTTGIYVPGLVYQATHFTGNYHMGWHKPANIEMYTPDGRCAFNSNYKISIAGESSQGSPQKGLNVTASSDYGDKKISYPFFQNTDEPAKYITDFNKIKIRAWGSDRMFALLHDAYCNVLMKNSGLDYSAYTPCVVFIDGEYWGLQEIRERNRTSDYFESHYFINKDNPGVDILKGDSNTVIEGDASHWDAMIDFIYNNTLSDSTNYEYVKTQMDVDNYMRYFMFSIYLARADWPDQNEAKWHPRISESKWKWIQWDMDNGIANDVGPAYDMYGQVLTDSAYYGPSNLLIALMQNLSFRNDFINLNADYINTFFIPPYADQKLDDMSSVLRPYIPEYQNRWQLNYNWETRLDSMKLWLNRRPRYVKEQIMNRFSSGDSLHITLNVSDSLRGNIRINTILLDENTPRINQNVYPWRGVYFKNIPIKLSAIAKPGYRFIKWMELNDTNRSITYNLSQDETLTALFDIDTSYHHHLPLVINEVMSSNITAVNDNYGGFDDWMEIYNPNDDTINVSGYYLTDNLVLPTRFKIAEGNDSTKIPPHGFLLTWMDAETGEGILHAPFKFSSTGDFIALVAPDGESIVDSLTFGILSTDQSYGCSYDASPDNIFFNPSTPDATNWIYTTEHIFINELQTKNTSTIADNYGEYDQWIELFNPNSNPIDLGGWKISNGTETNTFMHGNDSLKIAANSYLLFWADSNQSQGALHLNFTLNDNGCVTLMKPNEAFEDSVCYGGLNNNESYGRNGDGNTSWITYIIPTPDSSNLQHTVFVPQLGNEEILIAYPNPIHGNAVRFNKQIAFTLYDALGRNLAEVRETMFFDMSPYEKGAYYIKSKKGSVVLLIKE